MYSSKTKISLKPHRIKIRRLRSFYKTRGSFKIPDRESLREFIQRPTDATPIASGRINGAEVVVCRSGADHPSPTCLRAARDWFAGLDRVISGEKTRLEFWATGTTPRPRYWYQAELLNGLAHEIGPEVWNVLHQNLYLYPW